MVKPNSLKLFFFSQTVGTIQSLSKSEALSPLHSHPNKTTEIIKAQKNLVGGMDCQVHQFIGEKKFSDNGWYSMLFSGFKKKVSLKSLRVCCRNNNLSLLTHLQEKKERRTILTPFSCKGVAAKG